MYKETNTIFKTKRIRLFAVIINCTIIMKTNSRFCRNAYVNWLSVNTYCSCFGADLPHLGETFSLLEAHCRGVWWGWVGVGGVELWHGIPDDMILREMIGHDIGIVDIVCPTELNDNWPVHVWAPTSPRTAPTLSPECGGSTFLPQEGPVYRGVQ